ncbi:MAG: hypothetical protein HC850_13465 [Rhodomicrobium sp.]|nr:hypothetical protein [Rhodomicrobium sp.]
MHYAVYVFLVTPIFDRIFGITEHGLAPQTKESAFLYDQPITQAWVPIQLGLIFGRLAVIGMTDNLSSLEILGATALSGAAALRG